MGAGGTKHSEHPRHLFCDVLHGSMETPCGLQLEAGQRAVSFWLETAGVLAAGYPVSGSSQSGNRQEIQQRNPGLLRPGQAVPPIHHHCREQHGTERHASCHVGTAGRQSQGQGNDAHLHDHECIHYFPHDGRSGSSLHPAGKPAANGQVAALCPLYAGILFFSGLLSGSQLQSSGDQRNGSQRSVSKAGDYQKNLWHCSSCHCRFLL